MVRQPSPFGPPFGSWAKEGLISARGAAACQPPGTGPGFWVEGGCPAGEGTTTARARTAGSRDRFVRSIGFILSRQRPALACPQPHPIPSGETGEQESFVAGCERKVPLASIPKLQSEILEYIIMLPLYGAGSRFCDGMTRREMLRLGGLGALGLALPQLLQAQQAPTVTARRAGGFGQARSCIVLFLMGGPPQHSTWDPKPGAPANVRGAFGPIATRVPGIQICELMPRLAHWTDKLT